MTSQSRFSQSEEVARPRKGDTDLELSKRQRLGAEKDMDLELLKRLGAEKPVVLEEARGSGKGKAPPPPPPVRDGLLSEGRPFT